ncbi:uncharacterized protein LOC128547806 [Mercenaria mercenaria]|uniref:uncharacterized protein LOC128547806 n=1 Tax=Mercenaria mercenaria TaxID=6596 RepID=UPI00234E8B39|nr:uncharacterized protein LOC128547806 [Mercenaria mercenaria]
MTRNKVVKFAYVLCLSILVIHSPYVFKQFEIRKLFQKSIEHVTNDKFNIPSLWNMKQKKKRGEILNEAFGTVHPRVILQYGQPRTASTLQFQILCMLVSVLHEHEKNTVGCYYDPKFDKGYLKRYSVIKTHKLDKYLSIIPSDSWIFITSKRDQHKNDEKKIKHLNLTVRFIADISLALNLGHLIVYKYQTIFRTSDEQTEHVAEYLRYWEILRMCCGRQMSKKWRIYLWNKSHDAYEQSTCKEYNISEIENLVMKTYIFKTFTNVESTHDVIGKPSQVDGDLNGNYCQRCNENISKRRTVFNKPCV